jgi:hypothetical protein
MVSYQSKLGLDLSLWFLECDYYWGQLGKSIQLLMNDETDKNPIVFRQERDLFCQPSVLIWLIFDTSFNISKEVVCF